MWKHAKDEMPKKEDLITLVIEKTTDIPKLAVCVNGIWYAESGSTMKIVDFDYWMQIKRP